MVRVRSVKRIAGDQPLDCPSIPHSLGGADKRTAGSRPNLFMSRSVGRLLAIGQAIAQLWDEPSAAASGSWLFDCILRRKEPRLAASARPQNCVVARHVMGFAWPVPGLSISALAGHAGVSQQGRQTGCAAARPRRVDRPLGRAEQVMARAARQRYGLARSRYMDLRQADQNKARREQHASPL
jgi:hypothetical protein